jgi:hypothetical protein
MNNAKSKIMKRTFTLLCLIIYVVCLRLPVIAQNIPNGDFENWTITSGVEKPDSGWSISDATGLGCMPYSSIKTTDKAGGNYAILLETNNCINFGGPHEGYAELYLSTNARPDSLRFKYKARRAGNDTAVVDAMVYNNSTPIGDARYYIDGTQGTYKEITIPFNYSSSLSTTAIDIFMSSDAGWNYAIGNRLWADDLEFVNISTGVGNNYNNNLKLLSCSPVPAATNLNVSFGLTTSSDVTIMLINMTGSVMHRSCSHYQAGNYNIPIDVSSLPTGIYICEVQLQNGEKAIERIIKQ